ncbi:acetylcholine receptor subunit alpha-1-A-like [Argopecten irradians]|uniref:acetylcholine receptor subunit alpha-1-A-like n=1 Tax=Argopecten irradians TaxID=31199 RepID=UPI0037151041
MVQSRGILVILMMISLASCQTSDDVKALLTDLFKTNSYNKIVRPVYHQADEVTVYVDLFLAGDIYLDEVTGKMTLNAYLGLSWYDEHLTWSKDDYNGVKTVYIPQDDIWKPDIILENNFNKLEAFGDASILTSVYSTGEVVWVPFELFFTICHIDVTDFPFDIQICTLQIAMLATRVDEVTLDIGSEGINFDAFEDSGEWHLLSSSIKLDTSGTHGASVT